MLTKMIVFITTTLFGSIGWWLGMRVGMVTAFMLSIVGTGLGIYAGKRLADNYEI